MNYTNLTNKELSEARVHINAARVILKRAHPSNVRMAGTPLVVERELGVCEAAIRRSYRSMAG